MRKKIETVLKGFLQKSPYEKWIIFKEDFPDLIKELDELFEKEIKERTSERK